MGEPRNLDRAASAGKCCVWVETVDGEEYRVPTDYDTLTDANNAAAQLAESEEMKDLFDRILVYDQTGFFKYKMERR